MSIRLEVEDVKSWYSSNDTIRGRVHLDLRTSIELTGISVSLVGMCQVALTRIDDVGQKFLDHAEETVLFLKMRQQVFPPPGQDMAPKYALRAGAHVWPFEFEFPWLVPGTDYKLPPSISDLDPDVALIRYFLKAETDCSPLTTLKFPSIGSACFPIVLLSSDDQKELESVPTYGVFQAQQSRVQSSSRTVGGLISRLVSTLAHDRSALCSNIAIFEISSELLLTPGLKFNLNINAKALKSDERICIYAVRVELVSRSYIRVKNLEQTKDDAVVLLDCSNLKLRTGDLLAQLKTSSLKIPDKVAPSFESRNLKRAYRLDVKIKWSHRPSSILVHKAQAGRLVWVRSGMYASPSYDTGEIVRPNREFPQAKWYYKC